jgi:phosphoserine phosphatase
VLAFAAQQDVDLSSSFAYGDHISDLDLLQVVGHPTVVEGNEHLDLFARNKGWPSIARVAEAETCA